MLPLEKTQTSEKDTSNLQDISISNNEERKICFIKKAYHEERPECCELYWKKIIIIIIATVSFLSNCIMIPDILTNLFFKKTFWMTAFNTIKFVPM